MDWTQFYRHSEQPRSLLFSFKQNSEPMKSDQPDTQSCNLSADQHFQEIAQQYRTSNQQIKAENDKLITSVRQYDNKEKMLLQIIRQLEEKKNSLSRKSIPSRIVQKQADFCLNGSVISTIDASLLRDFQRIEIKQQIEEEEFLLDNIFIQNYEAVTINHRRDGYQLESYLMESTNDFN